MAGSSAIVLHNPVIFYINNPEKCFWCGDPCCRVDVCYESVLCRDCEPELIEDLMLCSEVNHEKDGMVGGWGG